MPIPRPQGRPRTPSLFFGFGTSKPLLILHDALISQLRLRTSTVANCTLYHCSIHFRRSPRATEIQVKWNVQGRANTGNNVKERHWGNLFFLCFLQPCRKWPALALRPRNWTVEDQGTLPVKVDYCVLLHVAFFPPCSLLPLSILGGRQIERLKLKALSIFCWNKLNMTCKWYTIRDRPLPPILFLWLLGYASLPPWAIRCCYMICQDAICQES